MYKSVLLLAIAVLGVNGAHFDGKRSVVMISTMERVLTTSDRAQGATERCYQHHFYGHQ